MKQSTHVFMADQLHELELAVGPLGVGHILEGPAQFFDGHLMVGEGVQGRAETGQGR